MKNKKTQEVIPGIPSNYYYHGIDVRFSAEILLEKLGPPTNDNRDLTEEHANLNTIDLEWHLVSDSGIEFYLYAVNVTKNPKAYQDFRIAAESKEKARVAADCVINFVIYGKDEHPGA